MSLPISEYVLCRFCSGTPARLPSCVHKSQQLLSCEGAADGGRCGVNAHGEQKTRMLAAHSVERVTDGIYVTERELMKCPSSLHSPAPCFDLFSRVQSNLSAGHMCCGPGSLSCFQGCYTRYARKIKWCSPAIRIVVLGWIYNQLNNHGTSWEYICRAPASTARWSVLAARVRVLEQQANITPRSWRRTSFFTDTNPNLGGTGVRSAE